MEEELQNLRAENARLKLENERDNEALAVFVREANALGPMPADGDAAREYFTSYMEAVCRYMALRLLQTARLKREGS